MVCLLIVISSVSEKSSIPCGSPVSPIHGTYTIQRNKKITGAYFQCNAGYLMQGRTLSVCVFRSAQGFVWSDPPPLCKLERQSGL